MTDGSHGRNDLVIHQDRRGKPLAAVNHAVTRAEQMQAVSFGRPHMREHSRDYRLMRPFRKPFVDGIAAETPDSQARLGRAKPLANAREGLLSTLRFDQRELDGRTTRVEHQHSSRRLSGAVDERPTELISGSGRARRLHSMRPPARAQPVDDRFSALS